MKELQEDKKRVTIKKEYWHLEDMAVGDYIRVQIENKIGNRNLNGMELSGTIMELVPTHRMVRLHTGWCAHTKDILLAHVKKEMREIRKELQEEK